MTKDLILSNRKILVTGATGWVGRSFLHELQSVIPSDDFNSTVSAFASRASSIVSTNYPQDKQIVIPIHPLSSITSHSCCQSILLFHSAFLTKDQLSRYGLNAFIQINQNITTTVSKCIQVSGKSRVVCISSGAASNLEKEAQVSSVIMRDPYGYLKLSEEMQLASLADTQVFRIYALTGRFIRDPQAFAIGDFLLHALKKQPIVINSTFPVIRSYVSASDIAKCALSWLFNSDAPQAPIGASSCITTLVTLADLVTKIFCLPPPLCNPFSHAPNSYSCSPILFTQLLSRYGIKPLPLADQVLDTANGLRTHYA